MTTNQDWDKTERPQGAQSTPWSCANGAGTLARFQLSQGGWPDPLSNLVVPRPGPETQRTAATLWGVWMATHAQGISVFPEVTMQTVTILRHAVAAFIFAP